MGIKVHSPYFTVWKYRIVFVEKVLRSRKQSYTVLEHKEIENRELSSDIWTEVKGPLIIKKVRKTYLHLSLFLFNSLYYRYRKT